MTAARILSRKSAGTVTIESCAMISQAIGLLSKNNIVAGILSERDIIHGFKQSGASLLEKQVRDIMTTDIQTCAHQTRSEIFWRL